MDWLFLFWLHPALCPVSWDNVLEGTHCLLQIGSCKPPKRFHPLPLHAAVAAVAAVAAAALSCNWPFPYTPAHREPQAFSHLFGGESHW
jgi:hypothetical protein